MVRFRSCLVGIAAAIAAFGATGAAWASEYHDDRGGFRFEVPSGWKAERDTSSPDPRATVWQVAHPNDGALRMCLVGVSLAPPGSRVPTQAEIDESFGEADLRRMVQGVLTSIGDDGERPVTLGFATIAGRRVGLTQTTTIQDGREMVLRVMFILTPTRSYQAVCGIPATELETARPALEMIEQSFRVTP